MQKVNGYTILMGELPKKQLLGLPRRIWESGVFAQSKNCGARETAVAR
jgi:hypothetical protein